MTIHWKAVEQYFTVVLFTVKFNPAFNFAKFPNFEHGTVRTETVNGSKSGSYDRLSPQANPLVQLLEVLLLYA